MMVIFPLLIRTLFYRVDTSVETANELNATTSGTITATITSSSVANLTELEGTNAYTIKIEGTDATAATASQLTTINNATTVAVDASEVQD